MNMASDEALDLLSKLLVYDHVILLIIFKDEKIYCKISSFPFLL